jgi:hypothetical protein
MKKGDAVWSGFGLICLAPIAVLFQMGLSQGCGAIVDPQDLLLWSVLFLINTVFSFWFSGSAYIIAPALAARALGVQVFTLVFAPFMWSVHSRPKLRWVGLASRSQSTSGYVVYGSPNPTAAQVIAIMLAGPFVSLALVAASAYGVILRQDYTFSGVWFASSFTLLVISFFPYQISGRPSPGSFFWSVLLKPGPALGTIKSIWATQEAVTHGRPRDYPLDLINRLEADDDLRPYGFYLRYARLMDLGQIEDAGSVCAQMAEAAEASDHMNKSIILWEAAIYAWRHGSNREAALHALTSARKASERPMVLSWKIVEARVRGDETEAQKVADALIRDFSRLLPTEAGREHLRSVVRRLLGSDHTMPLAGTGFFPLNT